MTMPESQKLGHHEQLLRCSGMCVGGGVTITKGDNKLDADLILNIYKIKIEEGGKHKENKNLFFF